MKQMLFLFFVSFSGFVLWGCVSTPETGKRVVILTSPKEEAQLGAQAFQEVLAKNRLANNPRWNALLQRVGQRISAAAREPSFQWDFKLIESPEKNAFCLPGGKVAFYTGIFPSAQTEAGIAAVMGHEVAHATARHAGQRITVQFGTQLGVVALGELFGGKDPDQKKTLLGLLGIGATVGAALPFSRANESEADHIGLIYMARAGYDPREAPKFWARMAAAAGGGKPPVILSTHPSDEGRRKALEAEIPKVWGEYEASPKYGVGEAL